MRVFTAWRVEPADAAVLAAWSAVAWPSAVARPVPPERLHVTLRFAADLNPATVAAWAAEVRAAGRRTGTARLGRGRRFGAKALGWELRLDPRLAAWAAGHAPHLRPHVTVARLRRGAAEPTAWPSPPLGVVRLTGPVLFRSTLEPDGPAYEPLAEG